MLRIPIQILFLGFILLLVDQLEAQQAIQQWPYTITFTEVKGDTTEVDVKDAASEVPIYHLAISDLFKGHYHLAEFHNGNLYTIRRTGGPDGYIKFPGSWTDALWKFDGSGNGKKIYSVRGLDFRVSPDERTIAINIIWDTLLILDSNGHIKNILTNSTYGINGFGYPYLTNTHLFFSNGGIESSFDEIFKVNLSNLAWSERKMPKLSFEYKNMTSTHSMKP